MTYGWKEGRNPSDLFSGDLYLEMYPDVKRAGICPLLHYEMAGKKEGRTISMAKDETIVSFRKFRAPAYVKRKIFQFIYRKKIKQNAKAKIAVHLHLFYEELWPEIKLYLKNLECYNFDLFITYPEKISEEILKDIKGFKPNVYLFNTPNKGFDLGPFIYFLHKINLNSYDIIFKLHTKCNIKNGNYYGVYMQGSEWRHFLYEAILGEKNVHKTVDALYNDPETGLVAHKKMITDVRWNIFRDL